jgi:RimJ/RimL family protein N-acetyltransferase
VSTPRLRVATTEDLVALMELEREANLVGLAHVFPAERFPFPEDDVLARWALVLEEPGVVVLVADRADRPDGSPGTELDVLAAHDDRTLRHLAVHPRRWGTGLATAAIRTVLAALVARGATEVDLWCLEDNLRARRLYEHLGWRPAGDRRPAPWPPHPIEMRCTRPLTDADA